MGGIGSISYPEPYQRTVGALCYSDYKGTGNQYVSDDKLIIERLSNESKL